MGGSVSKTYENWRQQLISGLAHAEAVIDFGDDEHLGDDDYYDDVDDEALERQQQMVWGEVGSKMLSLKQSMEQQLHDGRRGELIREGVTVAIVGPPNAGKSSLFNLLARRDAAIVSPIAGTTRDVIQVSMDLGGMKCTIKDTAGIRSETTDLLELEGIKRSQNVIREADLVVSMVDSTDVINGLNVVQSVLEDCDIAINSGDDDHTISSEDIDNDGTFPEQQRLLLVRNKLDLIKNNEDGMQHLTNNDTLKGQDFHRVNFKKEDVFDISCVTQEGIDLFLKTLTKIISDRIKGERDLSSNGGEGAMITRARHRQHVAAAVEALDRFSVLSKQGNMAVDMAAEELRLASYELGRITGVIDVEDVLDVLFTDFCIGK